MQRDMPYLAVFVAYYPMRPERTTPASKAKKQPDTSWRALLVEADLPAFNARRNWRAEHSKQDGVLPYVICTNRRLAVMLKDRPKSLTRNRERGQKTGELLPTCL